MRKLLIACILSQLFAVSAFAVTRHVPATYPTIQSAINAAADGDTVVVSQGTYKGTGNRDIDFRGKAIIICSEDPNDPNIVSETIIDCNGTEADPHRGFYFHSGEDQNSIINGLTITNGYSSPGGAVNCENSSPLILNCIFTNNFADWIGGAISNWENTNPSKIQNCSFIENTANALGGAVHNYDSVNTIITGCTFTANTALNFQPDPNDSKGGAIYDNYRRNEPGTLTLTDSTFTANHSYKGGAVYVNSNAFITGCSFIENSSLLSAAAVSSRFIEITDCIFKRNSSASLGAALRTYRPAVIKNCLFTDNSSTGAVGALYIYRNALLTNCLFTGNSGAKVGAISYNSTFYPVDIINCTFSGNRATDSATYPAEAGAVFSTGSQVDITNCILWNNTPNEIALDDPNEEPVITYSNIKGGYAGLGNISTDPCFIGPGRLDPNDPNDDLWIEGSYRLKNNSPCIDVGDPCSSLVEIWSVLGEAHTVFDDGIRDRAELDKVNIISSSIIVKRAGVLLIAGLDYEIIVVGEKTIIKVLFPAWTIRMDITVDYDYLVEIYKSGKDLDGRPRFADGDCVANSIVDMGAYEFNWAYAGDLAGGCDVNLLDFEVFQRAFLTTPADGDYNPACDIGLPADSIIDWLDMDVLFTYWLQRAD